MFLLLPTLTYGQEWGVTVRDNDSLICAPIGDMRKAAAYRRAQDARVVLLKWEAEQRQQESLLLREALAMCDTSKMATMDAATWCQENLEEAMLQLHKTEADNAKMKVWATVGKVSTFTVSFAVVVGAISLLVP